MPHSRTLPTPSNPSANFSNAITFYGAATLAAPSHLLWSLLSDPSAYPTSFPRYFHHTSQSTDDNDTTTRADSKKGGALLPFTFVYDPASSYVEKKTDENRNGNKKQQQFSARLTQLSPPHQDRNRDRHRRSTLSSDSSSSDTAEAEGARGASSTISFTLHPIPSTPLSSILTSNTTSSNDGSGNGGNTSKKKKNKPSGMFHAEQVIHIQPFEDESGNAEVRTYITVGGWLRKRILSWWGWGGHGNSSTAGNGGAGGGGMDEWLRQFVEDGIGGKVASSMLADEQVNTAGNGQGALIGEELAPRLTKVRGDDEDDNDDEEYDVDIDNDDNRFRNEEHKIVNPERKIWEDDEVPNDLQQ